MKKALIVGGARSGKYTALLLNNNNYQVTLTDINTVDYKEELIQNNIKVFDNGHPDKLLETRYDLVIKNPGIKQTAEFIVKLYNLGYKIYSEVDIALHYANKYQVGAITGTNGKTTTTTLLYEMLKKDYKSSFVGGNIGIPVSEVVYTNGNKEAKFALELSSFQLDNIYDLKPKVATITNLEVDHLDYYDSLDSYYLSKLRIYQNQDEDDIFILNLDDKNIKKYVKNLKSKIVTYSLTQNSDITLLNNKVYYLDNLLFDIDKVKLVGQHNLYNGISASLMAYFMGVSTKSINYVMENFQSLEHRIEYVKEVDGVTYYNDSKATNVVSTITALKAFSKPVTLIAGGFDKKVSFSELEKYKNHINKVILFGESKYLLQEIFTDAIIVDNLEEAVIKSSGLSKVGDIVLFSPACASFDQFKDYIERGECFIKYVSNLK